MQPERFKELMVTLTARIAGKLLNAALEAELNEELPASGKEYREIVEACRAAIAAGWMCNREGGGIKFGRVIKPGPETHGFSVDVVDMNDVVGPHHSHPNGEIDLRGRALVLYLLPGGQIEFTRSQRDGPAPGLWKLMLTRCSAIPGSLGTLWSQSLDRPAITIRWPCSPPSA